MVDGDAAPNSSLQHLSLLFAQDTFCRAAKHFFGVGIAGHGAGLWRYLLLLIFFYVRWWREQGILLVGKAYGRFLCVLAGRRCI